MAEVCLTLLDVLNRLRGGTINTRFSPKGKVGGLYIGDPLRLKTIIGDEGGRKGRLGAIQHAVQNGLQTASEALEEQWSSFF